jgi:DNA modification methylase
MNTTPLQLTFPIQSSPEGSVVYRGDALEILKRLPSGIFQVAVTSPPYWGLRDYKEADQIGSEERVDDYITKLTVIFRE